MLVDITASATQVAAAFSNSHSDRGSGNKSRRSRISKGDCQDLFYDKEEKKKHLLVHKQDCNIEIFKCKMILPVVVFEMIKDPVCYLSKLFVTPFTPCLDEYLRILEQVQSSHNLKKENL